jgi:hypothetical protein
LRRELLRRDAEAASLREEVALSRKQRQELSAAETLIEQYERTLTDLMRETEHGAVAVAQVCLYVV